ncbi:hypothetical protein QTO34_001708 [Cnephaeus nilssonii]|uniref:Uncharacterized protein n=1 Tax=Cnephaeus nilssonii TaxID=3371016 RepID=A0AA40HUB7_CNENI|nr:hypothetical protein QTO34_001708 [Eptesicus nilssonii]
MAPRASPRDVKSAATDLKPLPRAGVQSTLQLAPNAPPACLGEVPRASSSGTRRTALQAGQSSSWHRGCSTPPPTLSTSPYSNGLGQREAKSDQRARDPDHARISVSALRMAGGPNPWRTRRTILSDTRPLAQPRPAWRSGSGSLPGRTGRGGGGAKRTGSAVPELSARVSSSLPRRVPKATVAGRRFRPGGQRRKSRPCQQPPVSVMLCEEQRSRKLVAAG